MRVNENTLAVLRPLVASLANRLIESDIEKLFSQRVTEVLRRELMNRLKVEIVAESEDAIVFKLSYEKIDLNPQ